MQKNAYKIIALTLLLMLLCGCKHSRRLGERAIVKMVYLDESGGQVQAGLVAVSYTHLNLCRMLRGIRLGKGAVPMKCPYCGEIDSKVCLLYTSRCV